MNQKTGLIYCYTYIPTGEKYIGQTVNWKKRQSEHLTEKRTNLRFHNLLRKHYNDFNIEILEENIPVDMLNEKEKYYIKFYNSKDEGFNLTYGGDGGFIACQEYWEAHPEEKKKHIQQIQPLAAEAAKKWREENPELEQIRMENLHQKYKEWKDNNPEIAQNILKKAQEGAKKWREENPEKFKAAREKATEAASKKVKLLNTGEEFKSASEAGRQYNIPSSNISACCRGVRKSAGKNEKGEKLIWIYI